MSILFFLNSGCLSVVPGDPLKALIKGRVYFPFYFNKGHSSIRVLRDLPQRYNFTRGLMSVKTNGGDCYSEDPSLIHFFKFMGDTERGVHSPL